MGERPQYNLMMKARYGNSPWTRVGVAWITEKGFSLKLNPGVVLDWHDFQEGENTLGMFPSDEQKEQDGTTLQHKGIHIRDEIPF